MNPLQQCNRIDFDDPNPFMEELIYHLVRYKFVCRQLRKDWNVLELGCGTGYGAYLMSKYCKTVDAQDMDTNLLIRAKEKFINSNLTYTDQPVEGKYDVVVCLEVIEHMTKESGHLLLQNAKSKLKSNGLLFISTPRKIDNPNENRKKHHLHEYEPEEFRLILEEHFSKVLLFSQNDEIISSQNPVNAWNFMAVCFNGN